MFKQGCRCIMLDVSDLFLVLFVAFLITLFLLKHVIHLPVYIGMYTYACTCTCTVYVCTVHVCMLVCVSMYVCMFIPHPRVVWCVATSLLLCCNQWPSWHTPINSSPCLPLSPSLIQQSGRRFTWLEMDRNQEQANLCIGRRTGEPLC